MDIQELALEQQSLRKRVGVLEQKQAVSDILAQQSIETTKELSLTLKEFSITLVNINNSLARSDEKIEEVSRIISKIDCKVSSLEENFEEKVDCLEANLSKDVGVLKQKIEEVEEKGKFDIVLYIKQNFIKIILIAGALGYVVSQFIN